ncbi:MAG TPA: TetR/AcrR family transcriptional regulator [Microthrixaceae bacterium]|nr:TetR/AcrR family transcriptional regulator [Microthrixaceae bacterium]
MADAVTTRDRIMDAVVACIDRRGMSGFALEEVAVEAGVSRATIYRYFDGGRPQLVRESVTREVSMFWTELAEAVRGIPDLEGRLVAGMMLAQEKLRTHDLLQRLLVSEPDEFLPALFESEPLVHLVLRDYLQELLEAEELRPGLEREEAADYLARMLLVHIGSPGRWDMTDEAQVRRLVRTQFLAGVVASGN